MFQATLVGCGRIGELHAKILQKKGIKITSIFDINKEKLIEFKLKLNSNSIETFTDKNSFFSYLKLNKPNLAIVSTTTLGRALIIEEFLKIEIPYILSEKPLCSSMREINEISTIQKKSKSKLAINHQMRYLPQYQRIKELSNDIKFGGLISMHVNGGNFGLAMNGSHYVEAFRYLTNSPSKNVKADLESENEFNPRGNHFKEASGFVKITSINNQLMTINCSNRNHYGMHVSYICKYGIINVDELSGRLWGSFRKEEFRDLPSYRYGMPADFIEEKISSLELEESTLKLLEDLLLDKNYPNIDDGINTVKTIIGCYKSSRLNGSIFELKDLNPFDEEIFKWA
jgi:predicted dehydrogenase